MLNLIYAFDFKTLFTPNEIIGLAAGILILISFLMKGEIKIRAVNIFGALLFIIYGILIESISVLFVNAALFVIQGVKIILYWRSKNEII